MTNEKARDFFSAYYEETLESGLRVSFEQKLKADSDLRHEYDQFVSAMDSLDVLKFEDIEIPHDLHERISARLDRHIYDRKRNEKPAWSTWLKGVSFAGVAAVAILGAVMALGRHGSPTGVNSSDLVPVSTPDKITLATSADGVTVEFKPGSQKTVVIAEAGGKERSRDLVGSVDKPELKTLLSNPLPNAAVFVVQVEGERASKYIVVQGRVRSAINKGEGTVVDFAKAVADFYRMPVSLSARFPNQRVSWTFGSSDPVAEAAKALGPNYSVTQIEKNGILEIE
jgi:hypothetical protein